MPQFRTANPVAKRQLVGNPFAFIEYQNDSCFFVVVINFCGGFSAFSQHCYGFLQIGQVFALLLWWQFSIFIIFMFFLCENKSIFASQNPCLFSLSKMSVRAEWIDRSAIWQCRDTQKIRTRHKNSFAYHSPIFVLRHSFAYPFACLLFSIIVCFVCHFQCASLTLSFYLSLAAFVVSLTFCCFCVGVSVLHVAFVLNVIIGVHVLSTLFFSCLFKYWIKPPLWLWFDIFRLKNHFFASFHGVSFQAMQITANNGTVFVDNA